MPKTTPPSLSEGNLALDGGSPLVKSDSSGAVTSGASSSLVPASAIDESSGSGREHACGFFYRPGMIIITSTLMLFIAIAVFFAYQAYLRRNGGSQEQQPNSQRFFRRYIF